LIPWVRLAVDKVVCEPLVFVGVQYFWVCGV